MTQGYYGTEDSPLAELHSERKVITPQTSDGSLEEGRYRLRTDLDNGDRIATYEINVGDGVEEVPVWPLSADASDPIETVRQVYVPGEGWGFVSLVEIGAAYPELQFFHDGTWYAWHDSLTTIPGGVVYQYRAEDFADPWPDNVGSADMAVNGLTSSTFGNGEDSVAGDGSGDYGTADGPQDLPQNETFGIAMTIDYPSGQTDQANFFGGYDGTAWIQVREETNTSGTDGAIELALNDDNDNSLLVGTDSSFAGSGVVALIINKHGNSASDIEFYVDDMDTEEATATGNDEGFSHSDFNLGVDIGFYARNNESDQNLYAEADVGIFEFNTEPYSQDDRDNFVSRRPEV